MFAKFQGQVLNLAKRGIVIKGLLTPSERGHIEVVKEKQLMLGIPIVDLVKYLGVRMGTVSSDTAFAFPLGEAQRRASCITAYGLSIGGRVLLHKTRILPRVLHGTGLLPVRHHHRSTAPRLSHSSRG